MKNDSTGKVSNARDGASQSTHLTIGMFLENVEPYQHTIWSGVADCAREHEVNLLTFHGRALRDPRNFRAQGNILYELALTEQLDGLIIGASMGNFVPKTELEAFCRQYAALPVVSIMNPLDTIPNLVVDNAKGLQDLLTHLITDHGYQRIAFIKGPEESLSARQRYLVYTDVLARYDLPFDPNLVLSGNFDEELAMNAMMKLLDQEVEVDAVVAANDLMAFGVLRALQSRGIPVPGRMAVTGFDDLKESRHTIPPLTTVRQPIYELGYQAVILLLDQIQGKDIPQCMTLPTRVIVRQSCGCPSQTVIQARVEDVEIIVAGHFIRKPFEPPTAEQRANLLAEVNRTLRASSLGNSRRSDEADHLLEDFLAELQGESTDIFLPTFTNIVIQAILAGEDIAVWQDVLSVFRRHLLPSLIETTAILRAGNLWQQARVVLADMIEQAHRRQQSEADKQAETLRELSQTLITTFHVDQLMNVLAERLPLLGIREGYLCLYDRPPKAEDIGGIPEWSRLVLAYYDQRRLELNAGGRPFRSQQLLPEGMLPQARHYEMTVIPLYFQERQLGFAVFEARFPEGSMYEVLRGEISSALQGAMLVERVQEHVTELAVAYEEIRILNEQLKEENVRMSAELDVARQLQQMILPTPGELQQIEGLDIVGYMQPADEVGGDYYDVLKENDMIHIGIGDVTGHGLESGVLMLMTQTAIRTLIEYGETDPIKFVTTLNHVIYKNAQRMGADKTLTFALINYQDGQLKIVGQHEEMLVVRNGGQVERVDTIDLGFPIGLEEEIAQWVTTATVTLQPGDGIVLYTDGITEAENLARKLYGIERLCDVISRHWERSAEEVKRAVIDDVTRYIGKQKVYDDLTLVVLKQKYPHIHYFGRKNESL
jgi:serine phosphatase RsbU (regulator of sigma subunit)/DNA-binding LacI/PurR family transcriptional regulator